MVLQTCKRSNIASGVLAKACLAPLRVLASR